MKKKKRKENAYIPRPLLKFAHTNFAHANAMKREMSPPSVSDLQERERPSDFAQVSQSRQVTIREREREVSSILSHEGPRRCILV